MVTLALLHTSPVHVPVFDALRDEDHPGLALRHLVHEGLLDRARQEGPEAVADQLGAVLERAVADGAGAVLCTCSTIGGVAEARAAALGVPVLRVDRPMAAAAVTAGPAVTVLATVASTLAPTVALLEEEAERAARPVDVRTVVVDGAWERFAAGDQDGYVGLIAAAVERVAADGADVVVLAQASMADAAARCAVRVPVLASPRPGLRAAAALCGRPGS
ncbi:aspartate/glutamate racemase family protein [Streptomyces sp. AN091965]|uniref:aspartate/glutamate racemase family protein n=1 Tax=Streptomyces sp. AN091965 TaxID=2927803 RepID=UPI001F61E4EC|nr:aspartate/glutamate racemase family protein [Streptomyces sp. AN091965]MCI3934382.1 aspartate/glutamate racemase family protein [Streptomyces sp. AN091965]